MIQLSLSPDSHPLRNSPLLPQSLHIYSVFSFPNSYSIFWKIIKHILNTNIKKKMKRWSDLNDEFWKGRGRHDHSSHVVQEWKDNQGKTCNVAPMDSLGPSIGHESYIKFCCWVAHPNFKFLGFSSKWSGHRYTQRSRSQIWSPVSKYAHML